MFTIHFILELVIILLIVLLGISICKIIDTLNEIKDKLKIFNNILNTTTHLNKINEKYDKLIKKYEGNISSLNALRTDWNNYSKQFAELITELKIAIKKKNKHFNMPPIKTN